MEQITVEEQLRRQARIYDEINNLLKEAKTFIVDAKRIAEDNGLKYEIEGLVTQMINEVSDGQYWYGSDQANC